MEKIFYLAQVMDGIRTIAIIALAVCGLFAFIGCIICSCNDTDEYGSLKDNDLLFPKWIKKTLPRWLIMVAFAALTLIFVPNKRTYLFMVAGRGIDNVVSSNPGIKDIPANTLELLNEYIKLETEEIREKRNK